MLLYCQHQSSITPNIEVQIAYLAFQDTEISEDIEVYAVTVCTCEGRLERTAVLKAICAGFNETSDPLICLNTGLETNECLENNGGCWQDKRANMTACKVCHNSHLIAIFVSI